MAYVWIQPWYALPIIFEEPVMGDAPLRGQLPIEHSYQGGTQGPRGHREQSRSGRSSMDQEQRSFAEQAFAAQQRGHSPLNMEALASALPNYSNPALLYAQQQQSLQQGYSPAAAQGVIYQFPNVTPFAGQGGANAGQYAMPYNAQAYSQQHQHPNQQRMTAPMYPNVVPNPQRGVYPNAQQYPASPQQMPRPQGPYQSHFGPTGQMMANVAQVQSYQRPGVYNYIPSQGTQDPYYGHPGQTAVAVGSQSQSHLRPTFDDGQVVSRQSSASSLGPSIPRGPPPKPKQSGHALWIGNLPPNTTILDLKDFFSRDATDDIESVFLISKSNCAFANYKTEAACSAAMQRFNDTRFLGARLVCRLRRMNSSASAAASSNPSAAPVPAMPADEAADEGDAPAEEETSLEPQGADAEQTKEPATRVKEKFFIIKSLTVEDLELSVRNGIWATQAHNEAALNAAFETADDVYLIFSANKSGEYFGYARMVSTITDDSAASIDILPRTTTISPASGPELPNKIPTPATQYAPKGYVIDDSARGTIFWEAETAEVSDQPDEATHVDHEGATTSQEPFHQAPEPSTGETQSFGKPFRIEWVSTEHLPFYRTRGLRNPWNANREVKIARDGTELEPSIGRRLTGMFHRAQNVPAAHVGQPQQQVLPGYQMQPMTGYEQSTQSQQRYYPSQ